MKKSISLVLVALMFVILGCSLDSITGKKDDTAPPTTSDTADKDSDSKDSDSKDSDSKDSDSSGRSSSGLSMDKF